MGLLLVLVIVTPLVEDYMYKRTTHERLIQLYRGALCRTEKLCAQSVSCQGRHDDRPDPGRGGEPAEAWADEPPDDQADWNAVEDHREGEGGLDPTWTRNECRSLEERVER